MNVTAVLNRYKIVSGNETRPIVHETPQISSAGLIDRSVIGLTLLRNALIILIASASYSSAASGTHPKPSSPAISTSAPIQTDLQTKLFYKKAGHQIEAIAWFSVEAIVLSATKYGKGREAKISPIDFALGWGKMASARMLSQVSVTQANRFASMSYDLNKKIKVSDIVHNSSNMHLIPASREVDDTLKMIKKGQAILIEGYLVNIRHNDGWRWLTSTSRTDRGNGACEIVLVKSVTIKG